MIAPVFLGLLFATFEVSLRFFASQVLETATQDAARTVLTGRAQSNYLPDCPSAAPCSPADKFKNYLCDKVPGGVLFDCSRFYIDIRSYKQFNLVQLDSHIGADGGFVPTMQYDPGGPGDIVVVRVFYEWPTFVTRLGFNLANLANGNQLLVATATFKNELYQF